MENKTAKPKPEGDLKTYSDPKKPVLKEIVKTIS